MPKGIDPELLARYTGDAPAEGNAYRPWDVDYIHATKKVRCVPETAAYLYGPFTPRRVEYAPGSRPELEWHVEVALKNAATRAEKAVALMGHVSRTVLHTRHVPPALHELGGTEEHILRRGFGYCNEMARVLVTLAQIAGLPARLLFVRQPTGSRHVMAEILVGGKWGFFDASFGICLPVAGRFASGLDVQRSRRVRDRLSRLAESNKKCREILARRVVSYGFFFV
jgi:transglutaminase-like putative cysteine protease